MTFRLITLLYLFALLASSMAVLGPWGALVGLLVFAGWAVGASYPWRQYRWKTKVLLVRAGFVLFALSIVGLLIYPSMTVVRTPDVRNSSLNTLKQLTLAILNYHASKGHYPPPLRERR